MDSTFALETLQGNGVEKTRFLLIGNHHTRFIGQFGRSTLLSVDWVDGHGALGEGRIMSSKWLLNGFQLLWNHSTIKGRIQRVLKVLILNS